VGKDEAEKTVGTRIRAVTATRNLGPAQDFNAHICDESTGYQLSIISEFSMISKILHTPHTCPQDVVKIYNTLILLVFIR
jgi:hypothetical protein